MDINDMMGISKINFKSYENKTKRKELSKFICRIPDWTDQGGIVEFWINDDGSFESMDSRISDKDIRKGIENLLNW